jgi:putative transposase
LKASYPVTRLCHAVGVSPSGEWAWRRRGPSRRTLATTTVQQRIVAMHTASRATDGAPPTAPHGCMPRCAGRGMVRAQTGRTPDARSGAGGRSPAALSDPPARSRAIPRVRGRRTCCSERLAPPLPIKPHHVWVADRTYGPTRQGLLFLASVLDACSRRIVGWSLAAPLRAELVRAALAMALQPRRPAAGVIHHADHGSQSTAHAFQQRGRQAGIRSSMGSVGLRRGVLGHRPGRERHPGGRAAQPLLVPSPCRGPQRAL